jgi:transcriptional regulator with XRE-family HTH domain
MSGGSALVNANPARTQAVHRDDLAKRIGSRLKELRKEFRLTLKELSAKTNLSSPLLSRIENGFVMPPIPTLQIIADVLSVDIEFFFRRQKDKNDGYVINRYGTRRCIQSQRGPLLLELLAEGMENPFMQPVLITFPEKSRINEVEIGIHDGQEFGYVMEGKIELTLGEKKFILKKGDASYWNGNIPHRAVSVSKKPAKALNIHFAPGKRIPL